MNEGPNYHQKLAKESVTLRAAGTHANGHSGASRNASIPGSGRETPSSHRVPSAPSTEQTKIVFAKEGCPWDVA